MEYLALQTSGILAINCKIIGQKLFAELLIVQNSTLLNSAQTLTASFPEERIRGTVQVKIPETQGLYKNELIELCP